MVIRSVPFLVYGLIFIRVSGPGAFTGVLTLAVCSIGLLTKRFTEALDALDPRPYHALLAMGVRPLPAICHSVLPQLKPVFTSIILYRFDVNIREASVLGLVGAGGIGAPLIFSMNQYAWEKAGAIMLGLILLVWFIDMVSGKNRSWKLMASSDFLSSGSCLKNLLNLVVKFPKTFKGSFHSVIFLIFYNSQPYRTPYARHHPRTKYNCCLHIPA